MPHSTSTSSVRPGSPSFPSNLHKYSESSSDMNGGTEKFPDFDTTGFTNGVNPSTHGRKSRASVSFNGSGDRWQPRRDSRVTWAPLEQTSNTGRDRPRGLSNAIRHMRSGSMSQNAHEIADALRAPVSYRLIFLCVLWYWSSALTNTSSKSILTAFDKPATLTLVQFGFVSSYCLLFSWLGSASAEIRTAIPVLRNPIRYPTREVIKTTLPLAAFQIGGHLLSSTATSLIPVSLVHTIKGLSPLFTVLAYRFIFDIRYPRATYLSLIPLTLGVMLACSGKHGFAGEFFGILYALLATLIFVTQNIFSKRLFNEAARAEEQGLGAQSRKLDKLNLLCYSSGMAFIVTLPIWFWSEGLGILGDFLWDGSVDLTKTPNSFDHGRLTLEFIFNGTFHFGQNILAFVLLSMVSPVTYSVASLLKRVFVIVIALIWFQSPTTRLQAVGIALTFLGLYLYDRSSEKNKADQRARTLTETKHGQPLLPLNTVQNGKQNGHVFDSPAVISQSPYPMTSGYGLPVGEDNKKSDDVGPGRARGTSNAVWLPPGTKQEDTWRLGDNQVPSAA